MMQRKALFAVVLLGLALYIPSGTAGGQVTCTASCGTSTVSCTASDTCTAVDRNCPTTPGYVTCGGTTTYCPPCACTNGTKRYTQLSSCCYNEVARQCRRTLREETCINGNWRFSAYVCDGLNCSGSCPV
jgi:hypothetical protein